VYTARYKQTSAVIRGLPWEANRSSATQKTHWNLW